MLNEPVACATEHRPDLLTGSDRTIKFGRILLQREDDLRPGYHRPSSFLTFESTVCTYQPVRQIFLERF